ARPGGGLAGRCVVRNLAATLAQITERNAPRCASPPGRLHSSWERDARATLGGWIQADHRKRTHPRPAPPRRAVDGRLDAAPVRDSRGRADAAGGGGGRGWAGRRRPLLWRDAGGSARVALPEPRPGPGAAEAFAAALAARTVRRAAGPPRPAPGH